MVMQGFEAGLTDQFASVRRTLAGITADLPGIAVPAGATRGGDGAATPVGAGITMTIAPGAIVIQGGGAGAGQEAAEALLARLGQAATNR